MNKSKIDWPFKPLYVFNPILGCRHGCPYCYARRMNDRFKWIPVWTNQVFFHERLIEPYQRTIPTTIFVGSMCDMFGEWIREDWIKQVLYITEHNPQHTFMFLTKNPFRYIRFKYPANVMLGCTITDNGLSVDLNRNVMRRLKNEGKRTFVSVEPILSGFKGLSFDMFDLVIIGAQTGRKAIIPLREWVDSIVHPNIYYKNNILKYFPDLKNTYHEL
jgi:protein gp37